MQMMSEKTTNKKKYYGSLKNINLNILRLGLCGFGFGCQV